MNEKRRSGMRAWASVLAGAMMLSACASRRAEPEARVASEPPVAAAPRVAPWSQCTGAPRDAQAAQRAFVRRGATLEIDGSALAAQHCNVRVVDVREREEIEGDGHIPGAEWAVLSEIAQRAAPWNRDEPLVIVCRSGRRSARAVEVLSSMGFRAAASLTGGMIEWQRQQLPVDRAPIAVAPSPQ